MKNNRLSYLCGLLFLIVAICFLFLAAVPAQGQCHTSGTCQTAHNAYSTHSTYSTYAVAKPVKVIKEIYYPRYIAVFPVVDYPSYGAYYAGTFAPEAGTSASKGSTKGEELKAVLTELRGLSDRLKRLEDRGTQAPAPAPAPKPKPKQDPFDNQAENVQPVRSAVSVGKCALCHARGSEKAGGGVVLFEKDGKMASLSASTLVDLALVVADGSMPPKTKKVSDAGIKPLTDEERVAWLQEIAAQRQRSR